MIFTFLNLSELTSFKMIQLHISFILLALCYTISSCAELSLNQSYVSACTASKPCYLLDPDIWNNHIAPKDNDAITLSASPETCITFNATLTLATMSMSDISFALQGYSSLTIGSINLMGSYAVLGPSRPCISWKYAEYPSCRRSLGVRDNGEFVQNSAGFNLEASGFLQSNATKTQIR